MVKKTRKDQDGSEPDSRRKAIGLILVVCCLLLTSGALTNHLGESETEADSDDNLATVSATVAMQDVLADITGIEVEDETVIVTNDDGVEIVSDEIVLSFTLDADESEAQMQIEAAGYTIEEVLSTPNIYTGSTVLIGIDTDDDTSASVETAVAVLNLIEGVEVAEPNYIAYVVEDYDEEGEAGYAEESAESDDAIETESDDVEESAESGDAAEAESEADDEAESAETDGEDSTADTTTVTINDPYETYDASLDAVGAYDAWEYVKVNKTVTVAVLDTGVETTHEDLAANIVGTYTATGDDYECETSHGTHVAGIIAAEVNNALGVAGVSYNAGILAIDVSDEDGTIKSSYLVAAYKYLIDNASEYNVRVVNMSLGASGTIPSNLASQIDAAYAAGILTVAAAGNGAANIYFWPADYEPCVSVINVQISTTDTGYDFTKVSSSNYGEEKDISAPGYRIYSTVTDNSYGYKTGTSMASPLVAGVAALVFAADSSITVNECKNILYSTATDCGDEGYDIYFGWGVVNAEAAAKVAANFCDEHTFVETVITAATCLAEGESTYTCSVCGYSYTATTALTDHTYVLTSATEPTCEVDGLYVYTCSVCGEVYEETIAALEHEYEYTETVDATCTVDGYVRYTCTVCGGTYDEVIKSTGHVRTITEYVEPTCTETGLRVLTCTVCGDELTVTLVATGHSYEYVETVAATCTEAGYELYTCTVCGDSYTVEVEEALGHTWGEWAVTVEPTCTEEGVLSRECSVCGEIETEAIEATGHSYELTQTVDPTCTEDGYELYECTEGDDSYTVVLDATGHTAGEWVTTVSATLGYSGEEEQSCSVCGELLETREIEALVSVWERLAGTNRYGTMAEIVEACFSDAADSGSDDGTADGSDSASDDGGSEYAIVASGEGFADALAASFAAGVLDAPIVITKASKLSDDAAEQIERIGASKIVIVGGEGAVSATVASELAALDCVESVERIGGSTRYETSALIYEEYADSAANTAILACGTSFADALCASPLAYAAGYPILLTKTDSLPKATLEALSEGGFENVIVVGGEGVVSAGIAAQLEDLGISVVRLAGTNRYETSIDIAEYVTSNGLLSASTVAIATGADYPDALVGGVLAGSGDGVVLLSYPGDIDDTRNSGLVEFLTENRESIDNLYVLGGEGAVPAELEEALRWL